MGRFVSMVLAVFTVVCLMAAFERPAFGYVDPGSGFVALQTVASVMAAGGFFLRKRLRALFGPKLEQEGTLAGKIHEDGPQRSA